MEPASPAAPSAPADPVAQESAAAPTETPADETAPEAPEWGRWEYVGSTPMTYPAVPVTVEPGDVIAHLGAPAGDGRWQATDAEVSTHPDNHRPEPVNDTSKEG
jgi:hypothetical protein